ncbi:MAG: 30S ribosomal protein S6 [Planctomycetota bacterium]
MSATATELRQYEAMFLFGTAAGANLDNAMKIVTELVTKHGGEILVLKKFDERRLAYEIKKNKRGLYMLCYYKGEPSSVAAITRDVNLGSDVLRLLIVDASHLTVEEMEAVEAQKYEPASEERRRPRPTEGAPADGDSNSDGADAEQPQEAATVGDE